MRAAAVAVVFVAVSAAGWRPAAAQVDPAAYVNFEGAQTAPIRLSPDGTRLFAVNTADSRLSVFDVAADPTRPALIAEIPVGLEPVSVSARNNEEAWVVNQASDSISVVSVSRHLVVDTIPAKDEPADVLFVGNRAFVTIARTNEVRVFDVASRQLVKTIPLLGLNPRALAVNVRQTKVYVAFALSGNRTTIAPFYLAPPPPAPTNPDLPEPPDVAMIVDSADPFWSAILRYRVLDFDVAEIDVSSLGVSRYFQGAGTINLGLAVHPVTNELYVANTEARNIERFEPVVRGRFVDNRVSRISLSGAVSAMPLNPGVDQRVLPNPAATATALAQPAALVFEPLGRVFYVAAYGTDRVGVVDARGGIVARIELGAEGATADPRNKKGPRGLALHHGTHRLYVLNRISNTISIVDASGFSVLGEVPVGRFDPTPAVIREGRGFLYDAKLSGNGSASCASCHVDGDMDHLAWDLGDPGGRVQEVTQGTQVIQMHPMKGPMTTQSLRGLQGLGPLHWRGDRENVAAFNHAFDALMGGSELSDADMTAFSDFVDTMRYMPNPFQDLDRTLPERLDGGDPEAGRQVFLNENVNFLGFKCNTCHRSDPGPGTTRAIQFFRGQAQPFKIPQLRNVYQKLHFSRLPGTVSITGFGIEHDGGISSIFDLLSQAVFPNLRNEFVKKLNVAAFVRAFDTGMAPAVGHTRTLTGARLTDAALQEEWTILEGQAAAGNIDLIVTGTLGGELHGLLYDPESGVYRVDSASLAPVSRQDLFNAAAAGDTLTVMGTAPGTGQRMGLDRDLDGVLNGDEGAPGAASAPPGGGMLTRLAQAIRGAIDRMSQWAEALV